MIGKLTTISTRLTGREEGQATTEGAFVLPLFFLILFFIVQFGWILFSMASISYSLSQTQWAYTEDQVLSSTNDNELVRNSILASSTGLDAGNLIVENAEVELAAPTSNTRTTVGAADRANGIERITTRQQMMTIEADVTYLIPTLLPFPGLSEIEYETRIDKNKTVFTQFEVS